MGIESSRTKVKEGLKKTGESFKASDVKFGKDVKTKKLISDAASSARIKGTDEGMQAIKKKMEGAGEKTDRRFDQDDTEQKKTIDSEAKPREGRLREMTSNTQSDLQKINKALSGAEINEPKGDIKDAANAAQTDIKFTQEHQKVQENDRNKAEANARDKRNSLKGAPVRFKS